MNKIAPYRIIGSPLLYSFPTKEAAEHFIENNLPEEWNFFAYVDSKTAYIAEKPKTI